MNNMSHISTISGAIVQFCSLYNEDIVQIRDETDKIYVVHLTSEQKKTLGKRGDKIKIVVETIHVENLEVNYFAQKLQDES